jgi:branched-chain amino acid transport system permease protein
VTSVLLQNAVFGLLLGGLYGLGAVGLSLVFGVLAVLNVAHGELIMLGGYVSVWLFTLWRVDPFISVLVAGPALFLVGAVLFRLFFRRLVSYAEEDRIKTSILIGFGLALVVQTLAILAWGADERAVTPPYAGAVMTLGTIVVPQSRLGALMLAFVVLGGVHLFLRRTRMGTALRATADDEQGAVLVGIPIGTAYLRAFALGSALAGVAGALVSVSDAVSPSIGLHWTLKALIVIVLGGMGNILGTFVAGLFLGLAEATSGFLLGNAYREVVGLLLFLLVLTVRPRGLLTRP